MPPWELQIVTAFDSNYDCGFLCGVSHEAYAQKHGYRQQSWILDPTELQQLCEGRAPQWAKVALLRRLLRQALASDAGPRWIVWLDADTLLLNFDVKLEDFTIQDFDLIMSEDMSCELNTGVMILRTSTWSLQLLDEVWAKADAKLHHGPFHEQTALCQRLAISTQAFQRPWWTFQGGPLRKVLEQKVLVLDCGLLLLSVHAVVRSAHDACCTLTSEYVTNSECWSPCSYSLVNGRCTCEGDSLHDGLSSVCSYDASHVCSSDSSAGSTSTSTTLMGPVGEWVATGQCLSDIPDFWMSCGYVFQLQCASKTSYPVRGAIFWAPNPANTCSLPSTCNDVGDFLCCPEESWEPCLLYDWTAVGVVFLVILLLLMCCCVACCYCCKCCCFSESGAKRRKFTNSAPSQPELVGVGQGKGTDTENFKHPEQQPFALHLVDDHRRRGGLSKVERAKEILQKHYQRACPVTLDSSGDGPLAEARRFWNSQVGRPRSTVEDPGFRETSALAIPRGSGKLPGKLPMVLEDVLDSSELLPWSLAKLSHLDEVVMLSPFSPYRAVDGPTQRPAKMWEFARYVRGAPPAYHDFLTGEDASTLSWQLSWRPRLQRLPSCHTPNVLRSEVLPEPWAELWMAPPRALRRLERLAEETELLVAPLDGDVYALVLLEHAPEVEMTLDPAQSGWDPFSDTESPCHGTKLKRGEVLHVPRNAWFTLRALRRGWNLEEPLEVSGRSVWRGRVGAESFVCLSVGVGDLDEWQDI
eukprot:symbB.v1.2.006426.t1/scaffold383.1/size215797/8